MVRLKESEPRMKRKSQDHKVVQNLRNTVAVRTKHQAARPDTHNNLYAFRPFLCFTSFVLLLSWDGVDGTGVKW